MSYQTYFDAQAQDLLAYGPAFIGLCFLVAGAAIARLGYRARGVALIAFSTVFTLAAVAAIHNRQTEIADIFARREVTVIEGTVADFQPDLTGGHASERFRVGATQFAYRAAVENGGFHQTHANGGPIQNGRAVRIMADGQGRILKLDLAN